MNNRVEVKWATDGDCSMAFVAAGRRQKSPDSAYAMARPKEARCHWTLAGFGGVFDGLRVAVCRPSGRAKRRVVPRIGVLGIDTNAGVSRRLGVLASRHKRAGLCRRATLQFRRMAASNSAMALSLSPNREGKAAKRMASRLARAKMLAKSAMADWTFASSARLS